MTVSNLKQLEAANRQIDSVIRELTVLIRDVRGRTWGTTVDLLNAIDRAEKKARECERTLELMTRAARSDASKAVAK